MNIADKKVQRLIDAENKRIALRDQFAATAPITLDQVLAVSGDPDADMQGDHTRVAVYALWAIMRYEYADAMMAERRKTMFEAAEEQKPTTAFALDGSHDNPENKEGWIVYAADTCPVLWCTAVDVMLRDGSIALNRRADSLSWKRTPAPGRIVAYRVVQP